MKLSLRDRVTLTVLKALPQNTLSRAVGWALSRPVPRPLRAPVYGVFARRFGVDLDEAERDLRDYPSFDEFFTRRLKPGARTISDALLVSPVDGVVSQTGGIPEGRLIQAKGKEFTVGELLGEEREAAAFVGGQFLTIYLSPRDYHRIHSPADGVIEGYVYTPGRLLPVNPPSVSSVERLFSQNERVSTLISSPAGRIAVVKVGATCVGSISLAYDPKFRTNRKGARPAVRSFTRSLPIGRAEELGAFHMGSTVILLLAPEAPRLRRLTEGQKLRLGEPLTSGFGV